MTRTLTVLIGSPRGLDRSNSAALSRILLDAFDESVWTIDWIHLHEAVGSKDAAAKLVAEVTNSDLILFAAPLYVDSLPAPAIEAFERVVAARAGRPDDAKTPRFAVLLNCGFIEPRQNATAVEICRVISDAAGFEWFGDLALGGGGHVTGRIRKALREAGASLANGFPISPDTRKRVRRPVMPKLLYVLGGNLMWRRLAKANGLTKEALLGQPYV